MVMRLSRKVTVVGFAAAVAGAAAALAVAAVDGVASSPASVAVAAAPRLVTMVVERDVRPNAAGIAEISCPNKKTLRGGLAWVPVGGGVAGKSNYAVYLSYPSVSADRKRGWSAKLVQLPPLKLINRTPQQQLTTTQGLYPGPWGHSHHVELPPSLLVRGQYDDAYASLHMFVICASLAGAGSHRLFINVARRSLEVDFPDYARVGCAPMRVVAGGVVGETGYAVGGSLPTGNGKGWQGALTEFPRYTLFSNSRLQQTVLSSVGLRATFWSHTHHISLPGSLLVAAQPRGYSQVGVSAVCATITPATGVFRLDTHYVRRDVPVNNEAGKILCPKGSVALGGGVVGRTGYAVGSSYPVIGGNRQAIGWSGSLAELPHVRPLGYGGLDFQTVQSNLALNATVHQHAHNFVLPASLLIGGLYKGYSKVDLYVMCGSLGAKTTPATGITKTPRVPVTTTRPAPSAPPTTTAAPVTTTTTPNPPPTTTTTTEEQLPDLVVRKLSLDGSTLVWNIEIRNRGNGDAPASKTGLTQPTGSDERQIDTPPIKAGDSVTVTAQCPFGTIGKAKARADANNDVTESDEGNNNSDQVTGGIQGGDGESRCRFP
jgi:CARDB